MTCPEDLAGQGGMGEHDGLAEVLLPVAPVAPPSDRHGRRPDHHRLECRSAPAGPSSRPGGAPASSLLASSLKLPFLLTS